MQKNKLIVHDGYGLVVPWEGPGKSGVWQQGLFTCCGRSDGPTALSCTCILASCCFQNCTYADAAFKSETDILTIMNNPLKVKDERSIPRQTSRTEALKWGIWPTCMALEGIGNCCIPLSDVGVRWRLRHALIKRYQIHEEETENFFTVCCCVWCALDQMLNEIMEREDMVFDGPCSVRYRDDMAPGTRVNGAAFMDIETAEKNIRLE